MVYALILAGFLFAFAILTEGSMIKKIYCSLFAKKSYFCILKIDVRKRTIRKYRNENRKYYNQWVGCSTSGCDSKKSKYRKTGFDNSTVKRSTKGLNVNNIRF